LVLRERLPRGFLLAAALLMAGNVLLLAVSGPIWTDGTAYVLVATAMWAGEYTLSKRALRNLPSTTVALGRVGFGGVFLLAYLGLSGQVPSVATFGGADWMALFLSALLLFGFTTTWYAGLRSVDLSVATSLLVLAFPITWILGILSARSPFIAEQAAGSAIIAAGAGLILGVWLLRGARSALARRIRSWIVREA
jgi:drug/metabolite transporter (DMT)-like permease